ncbi:MAG: bacillithiol biosynthesis deacetylase BshB1 [Candidatus Eisenbacteria bacterium]|nr:bacillithiol biosynthesis deacetylase BshB1 [Candidatus Eisenbacteria bacterium]
MKVMAVGAHPDDVEMSCGGLVAKLAFEGHEVGIADLTCGEMGSSGTEKTRLAESSRAARILGVSWRVCCGLPDSGLDHSDTEQVYTLVGLLRERTPSLVLAPWRQARHPDHTEAAEIVRRAVFLAGLRRLPVAGRPHASTKVLYYMGDSRFEPTLVVDVTRFFEKKMRSIHAYRSQFDRSRPDAFPTRLNAPGFLDVIENRARYLGDIMGVKYAEGFLHEGPVAVDDPAALVVSGGGPRRRPKKGSR